MDNITMGFDNLKFESETIALNNNDDYVKTYTFKNVTEEDCENLKEIYEEIQYLVQEVKKLRNENKELKEFICD
jgi:hypothetical protein